MSKKDDKLKKPKARLSQPPDSIAPGPESAYGHGGRVSTSNKVAFVKTERLNPIGSGILRDTNPTGDKQPDHSRYPGRATPPVQKVTQVTVKSGVGKRCADIQGDSNRREMNRRASRAGQP